MDVELEFGVPFPGRIVPQANWTQTAIKRLPIPGPFNWRALFGREAPRIIDLGCGNGRFLIAHALAHPECDHLGVDCLPVVIRYAVRRANQRGLTNIRFAVADAREVLERLIPPHSVAEIHIYHPQPYYDLADVHRRLIAPKFLCLVHRALQAGGKLYIQSDNPGYWDYIGQIVPIFFDFQEHEHPWPEAPQGRTRREILALQRGLPVFRGIGIRRDYLQEAEALQQAEALPPPVFNADRRLFELDRLERLAAHATVRKHVAGANRLGTRRRKR
ncbi:tRNA (guanine-N(7)-)-methyltransferase [bacterium HR36]|nr:tRNA (guanine-N(7)-)-methyltransferase [bacterium HR36]